MRSFTPLCDLFRGPKTQPKSRNTKKTPRSHELFRKVRANFCLLLCDASQEHNENCSEELVQMNFFILGGFFRVDFPPLTFACICTPLRSFLSFCVQQRSERPRFGSFRQCHSLFAMSSLALIENTSARGLPCNVPAPCVPPSQEKSLKGCSLQSICFASVTNLIATR